ncbi:MAG: YggS family pyridoxal phosphate-dependent enzyme [Deltaproteobacteria bacterium]|nr:YggS family pyridoxal phosphate-dependent enzyme [Deltaproteobacteria bacterium]
MNNIENNISVIKKRIEAAAKNSGRNPNDINLVAVSKRQPVQAIIDAYNAGQRDFGENYAQELREKATELASYTDINWHYIGHLQTNKVKYVAPYAHMMECIDSTHTASEFSKQANKFNRKIDILLQVNIGNESQKHGCSSEDAKKIISEISVLGGIRLKGLMAIVPYSDDPEEARVYFHKLKLLRDTLGGKELLPHLSMGMSNDYEVAIQEGSTIVRVGTAIFGERI